MEAADLRNPKGLGGGHVPLAVCGARNSQLVHQVGGCVWPCSDLFYHFSTLQHVFPIRHSHATSVQLSQAFKDQRFTTVYNSFIHSLIHGTLCFQEAGHSRTGDTMVHSPVLRRADKSAGLEWRVLRGRKCQSSGSPRGSGE